MTTNLSKFKDLKVLIIGDLMLDAYVWGSVNRISPEAPVPVLDVSKRENRLGGAGNVALNIKALDAKPIICSVIGTDNNGKALQTLLAKSLIDTTCLIESKSRKTTLKKRFIAHNQQVLRVDDEISKAITKEESEALLQKIENYIDKHTVNVIIFEDYDKGVITPALIEKVVELANKKAIPTVVDPKNRNFLHYKNVSLFKPNFKELKEGLKIDFATSDQPALEKAITGLRKDIQAELIMCTLSEQGVYIQGTTKLDKEEKKHLIPAHVRNVADVSGAGDTVVSVAALCLAAGYNAYEIAGLANLAGGLVCEEVGVATIDLATLIKEADLYQWQASTEEASDRKS